VGFTLAGMPQVIVFVFVPMDVSPVYVVIVNVIVTDVPVTFCFAKSSGGVQLMLMLLDFVATVPDALPHLYVIVCVKLVSYLLTVSFKAVPSVPLSADKLLFLAIVFSVPLPDPVFVPMLAPLNVIENCWLNEYENVFVPLELWAMTVVSLASVFVVLFDIPTVFVPLYVLPLTVTDHFFCVVESMRPSEPAISSNFQLTVDVLFATD
jgi:hypothetical protein